MGAEEHDTVGDPADTEGGRHELPTRPARSRSQVVFRALGALL